MPLQVTFLAQWASIDIVIATRQFRDNVFDPQIIYMAHTFFLPIQVGTHREALGGRGPTTALGQPGRHHSHRSRSSDITDIAHRWIHISYIPRQEVLDDSATSLVWASRIQHPQDGHAFSGIYLAGATAYLPSGRYFHALQLC